MKPFLAILALILATPASAEITWPVEQYDPAAATGDPADLILPLPCGGAMAFQQVTVQVDADNPLSDRRIRVGQPQPDTGYSDYLRTDYLRGAFPGNAPGESAYFIARYELTDGQYRALTGDCGEITRRDRIAKGALSWFDAVALSQSFSEYLLTDARDSLPPEASGLAYVRLPTETEWEFAARGGGAVDPATFPSRRFFGDGDIREYAKIIGTARGKLLPVGIAKPNPLGLYDIYGNVEEIMLEPFRLNAIGRAHGQVGGMVTRGGSISSTAEQVYSAQRTEYPLFRPEDGLAMASDVFGVRFVLSRHIAYDGAVLDDVQKAWVAQADQSDAGEETPLGTLALLIDEETDPRRSSALSELQLEFRRAQEDASAAFGEAAKSTLLNGAVLIGAMRDGDREIARRRSNVYELVDQIGRCSDDTQCNTLRSTALRVTGELNDLRALQHTYLVSLRSALETLSAGLEEGIVTGSRALLQGELQSSGQLEIQQNLEDFDAILAAYSDRPDMTEDEIFALVRQN